MFRKFMSTYPKYTTHSQQYRDKVWRSLEKEKPIPKWGEINKKNTTFEKPKENMWWFP